MNKKEKAIVNVVVTTYNGEKFVEKCLSSIIQQNYPSDSYFVTVLDDASTDGTSQILRSLHDKKIRIFFNEKNMGFANANNLACSKYPSDYILFVNLDSWVENDFILQLVSVMEKDHSIGMCGGAEHPYDKTLLSKRMIEETNWVGCGATIVRTELFQKLGMFDTNYYMYGEDIDLSWRLKFSGFKVYYTPYAIWHHFGWKRTVAPNDRRIINSSLSRLYLLFKFGSFYQISCSLYSYIFRRRVQKQTAFSPHISHPPKQRAIFTKFFLLLAIVIRSFPKICYSLKNRNSIHKLPSFDQKLADSLILETDQQIYGSPK